MVPVYPPSANPTESQLKAAVASADSVGLDISAKVLRDVNHALPGGGSNGTRVAFVSGVTQAP
jgi:hypothetical protein